MADGASGIDRDQRRLFRYQRQLQRNEAGLRDFLDELLSEMTESELFDRGLMIAVIDERENVRAAMKALHASLARAVGASSLTYAGEVARSSDDPGDGTGDPDGGGSDTDKN